MSLTAHIAVERGPFRLDVELDAAPGAVVAVLGTNGAGKSTVLDAIAGSVPIDAGRIELAGTVVDEVRPESRRRWVAPHRRRVGMVPQDVLLFPHLSIADNIGFGPRSRGVGRPAARAVAAEWLDRIGLAERAADRPSSLSGGQSQRVALARALATEPDALLLDEPLAALDATTRQRVRRDLRRWLEGFAGSTIVVTHDPLDALMLAGRVVVLEQGSVSQEGSVAEVAARPRTPYVADLLGTNLLRGTATGRTVLVGSTEVQVAEPAQGDVLVTISPRSITVHRSEPTGSARNRWPAPITAIDLLGEHIRLQTGGAMPLAAEITAEALTAMDLQVGDEVWLATKASDLTAYQY